QPLYMGAKKLLEYSPTWLGPTQSLLSLLVRSAAAQRLVVILRIVVPVGIGQFLFGLREFAAKLEHGAHTLDVHRRLARERTARAQQLVVAALGLFRRHALLALDQDRLGLAFVGR